MGEIPLYATHSTARPSVVLSEEDVYLYQPGMRP